MSERNATEKFGFISVLLVVWTSVSVAQPDSDLRRDVQNEFDLRHADHREITAPFGRALEQYRNFLHNVYTPGIEEQLMSKVDLAQRLEIPHSLRSQMVRELSRVHAVAQDRSASYSRFERDQAECQLWVSVIQYYLDGLNAITEEMGKSDLPASAFSGMVMNQVSTALFGVGSLHPAVLPCFLEKGQYTQPVIAMVREKADELRGAQPPESPPRAN